MTAISKSIVANTVSKAIIGALNIIVVPFYVRYLGIEAYGLVGFFTLLQMLFVVLDLGFSLTLTRSLSQLSLTPERAQESRNLARTLEIAYWTMALIAGCGIALIAPLFVHKGVELSYHTVRQALLIMTIALTFQFPVGFYTAGLVGLQRQIEQSVVNACFWVVRSLGALVVLHYVAMPVLGFFYWQTTMSLVTVASMGFTFWQFMPAAVSRTRASFAFIRSIAGYASGMSGMTILLLIFHQTDKAIISWKLPWVDFGYYTTASQVASALFLLYMPIYTAYFPVFAQKLAQSDRKGLSDAFHRSCQLMSVLILPFVCLVTLFAPEVLRVWLHNPELVDHATPLVRFLMPGAAAGAMLYMPWAVQQASGRFKEGMGVVLVGILTIIPSVFISTSLIGVRGGALSWMVLTTCLAIGLLVVVYRTTLIGEWRRWLLVDVGRPLVMSLVVVGGTRLLWTATFGTLGTVLGLVGVYGLALLLSASAVPAFSGYFKRLWLKKASPR